MTTKALRSAWKRWRDLTDSLDLSSDATPDVRTLHARLFRLCAGHLLKARHLDAVRQALLDALDPWLNVKARETGLARLRRTFAACSPAWAALLGRPAEAVEWAAVARLAETSGMPGLGDNWWSSPFHASREAGFDPVLPQARRPPAEGLAVLEALLRVARHPQAERLWLWIRHTPILGNLSESLSYAFWLSSAAESGALTDDDARLIGLDDLANQLADLCERVCRCLLENLLRPLRTSVVAVPTLSRESPAERQARPIYRRTPPDPLPIEPYFQEIAGSEAFLRAIAEEPLEDAHRLAFADWLEDHGHQERAAFIRLQCQVERLPRCHAMIMGLEDQIADLFNRYGSTWTAGLPDVEGFSGWNELENFHRGMLERVSLWTDEVPIERCRPIFVAADVRRLYVHLYDRPRVRGWLRQPPPQLVHLEMRASRDSFGKDLRAFAQSPALAALDSADFVEASVRSGERGHDLLELMPVNWLRRLHVSGTDSLPPDLGLPALRALEVYNNYDPLSVLANWPPAAGLRSLRVRYFRKWEQAEPLGRSPLLENLEEFYADDSTTGTTGVRMLVNGPSFGNLRVLDLSGSVTTQGVQSLSRAKNLANVTALGVGRNWLSARAGESLAGPKRTTDLRSLNLFASHDGNEIAEILARSDTLGGLEALNLRSSYVSDAGAKALVGSKKLTGLRYVDLADNSLSEKMKSAVRERWPLAHV
jgi:uncharacterized protein (TIGR02996 family)